MNLTRHIRSFLAGSRRELASVLTVMFFVLTLVGGQAVCDVPLDERGHSGTRTDGTVGQYAAPAVAGAVDQAVEVAPGHPGEDPYDCFEGRTVTAGYDWTVSPSPDLAEVPHLAVQWLVPGVAYHGPGAPSGVVSATAPSLHALGISRT
ncbi:hypothetical protein [Promicromonospora soli]